MSGSDGGFFLFFFFERQRLSRRDTDVRTLAQTCRWRHSPCACVELLSAAPIVLSCWQGSVVDRRLHSRAGDHWCAFRFPTPIFGARQRQFFALHGLSYSAADSVLQPTCV